MVGVHFPGISRTVMCLPQGCVRYFSCDWRFRSIFFVQVKCNRRRGDCQGWNTYSWDHPGGLYEKSVRDARCSSWAGHSGRSQHGWDCHLSIHSENDVYGIAVSNNHLDGDQSRAFLLSTRGFSNASDLIRIRKRMIPLGHSADGWFSQ